MNTAYTYQSGTDWVGYAINEDKQVFVSAHTDKKYSFSMIRAIIKTVEMFKISYTIIEKKYIYDLYSKHFDIMLIDKDLNLYTIKKIGE
jgi:hypothetical protein